MDPYETPKPEAQSYVGLAGNFAYGQASNTFSRVDKNVGNMIAAVNTITGLPTLHNAYDRLQAHNASIRASRETLRQRCVKADKYYSDNKKNDEQSITSALQSLKAITDELPSLAGLVQEIIDNLTALQYFATWKLANPKTWAAMKFILSITTKAASHGVLAFL